MVLSGFIFSCTSNKPLVSESQEEKIIPLVSFKKTPCFGKCQVYQISLYQDGLVILEGIENIEFTGILFSQLSSTDLENLRKELKNLHWQSYKSQYFRNIPDLPTTELRYYHREDSSQIIKSNTGLPDELESIQKKLASLVGSLRWTSVMKKHEVNAPHHIYNEIQVDMDSTLQKEFLEKRFASYELKSVQRISIYMNYWLFQYNEKLIKPVEMLILIRRIPGVRLAMFNKKLDPRGDF